MMTPVTSAQKAEPIPATVMPEAATRKVSTAGRRNAASDHAPCTAPPKAPRSASPATAAMSPVGAAPAKATTAAAAPARRRYVKPDTTAFRQRLSAGTLVSGAAARAAEIAARLMVLAPKGAAVRLPSAVELRQSRQGGLVIVAAQDRDARQVLSGHGDHVEGKGNAYCGLDAERRGGPLQSGKKFRSINAKARTG